MRGLIWNCQGLGRSTKFDFLREIIREEKIDFVGLQETKKDHFNDSLLSSLAGSKLFAWFSSPPNGRSGGLLVGFNSEVFDAREFEPGEFLTRSLVLHREKNFIWNFVNVYGAAQKEHKSRFLSELSAVCSRSQVPMLIGGDFNILRKAEEKNKPGALSKWSFMFNSIIDHHGLVEFELKNRLYMWSNNRSDPTFEKLDRFLASPDSDLAYNNMSVIGLNRSFSDHAPLCLQSDTLPMVRKDFRYELCWKVRPDFHNLVKNVWSLPVGVTNSLDVWKLKLKRLRQKLKGWNSNIVGHYKKLKKNLIEKIDILDKASETSGLSDADRFSKLDLESNLKKIVNEENISLRQKARDKFLLEGDENSKYFHLLAKHKKEET
jgi:exonuclease III